MGGKITDTEGFTNRKLVVTQATTSELGLQSHGDRLSRDKTSVLRRVVEGKIKSR